MEAMVLFLIFVGMLIGLIAAAVMVADVALFGGERRAKEQEESRRRWRAPYVGGRDLFTWARKVASEVADGALGDGRTQGAPSEVARTLHGGATRAMLPDAPERELRRILPCPVGGQGPVGVTTAEAIAIAEHVRWSLPGKERERIRSRARRLADEGVDAPTPCASRGCALQGPDNVCLVFQARPLQCRPLHAEMILGRRGADGRQEEADVRGVDARSVAEGMRAGWTRSLEQAGVDAHVYELNAALAAALSLDDACLQWLEGQAVFVGCRELGGRADA